MATSAVARVLPAAAGLLGASASVALLIAVSPSAAAVATARADGGGDGGFALHDRRITESSGLAASALHKGVYWTHNDSDDGPYVYAVDASTGRTVATVTLRGITPRDVEAVTVGPHGDVYVGDIGDNLGGTWPEVWIYHFREPARLADTTLTPDRYTVRYADGPRDAEALMVQPRTGRLYIASKSQKGQGGVYEGPGQLSASGVNVFRRIARTDLWVTDGAFSPDGTRLVLRGYFNGAVYRWRDGRPHYLGPVTVPFQEQGESVTFTRDGRTLLFGSEGADSPVKAVRLSGEQLPDSAAAEEHEGAGDGRSGKQDGKDGGGGAASTSGTAGDGRGDGGGTPEGGHVAVGAGVVLAAAVLWWGARRLFRRGG